MSNLKPDDVSTEVKLDEQENSGLNEETNMPSAQQEEEAVKKKYGGIMPRKPPLISKDHERAYFDSADWALGKQGANPHKPKGPLEALRPKLQPTSQQARSRRSPYASNENLDIGNDGTEDVISNEASNEENPEQKE
ncbi:hypothetical protein LUZ60_008218 [Juncus effusus]|nr:hypothetical protein LUZ60_008218 [Juncus effusus]